MTITFGLALDGFRSSCPVFNHLFCGPLGLVDALELRFGISHQHIGAASRLHRFLQALEAVALTKPFFFSESLKADRWGTAATLLDMRDELRMAGWNGKDSPVPRLRDFGEVESRLGEQWGPGPAERIDGILNALESHHPGISEVACVDRPEFLPHQLHQLLEKLGAKFVHGASEGSAPEGTNLRLVQDALSGKDIGEVKWGGGDDSVLFLTAFSEVTLAHAAARLLPPLNRPAFLATVPAQAVADVIRGFQQPAPALDTPSPLRPIVQVLGLALEMRWSPPDPAILLQFLTHPVSPIERGLRSALADAVADQPGIGSKAWTKAIENYRERIEKSETLTSEEKAAKLSRIEKDLKQWIVIPGFPRKEGAPGEALAETARQLENWAGMRASMTAGQPESRHFSCLAAHAAEFAAIAKEIPRIQAEELSHILEQVCASAPSAGDQLSELGCCDGFSDASAIIEPRDAILWWGFENQESRFLRRWSEQDCQLLRDAGIFLSTAETHLAKFHEMAVRPFLAARKQIVLLWPKSRGGDAVEMHPLCTLLAARFGHLPIRDLDRDDLPLEKADRCVVPLPPKKRWIKLPNPALLQLRKEESYSSLSKFVLRPFEWVFNYPAKLRRGTLREINPFIQRGNLVHHVVEHLLEAGTVLDWKNANKGDFDQWLDNIWLQLLEHEGANLLQPGWQTDGQRLLEDARRSVWTLIAHMKNAGVVSAKADERLGPIPMDSPSDPHLSGFIDLLVTDSKGQSAVVDLKFSQGKAKRKELETNTALQLAVYAKLVHATSGQWPDISYFILRSASLLTQTNAFFSDAEKITSPNAAVGPQAIWNSFLEVWRWRMGQIQSGWIEFPLEGTDPTDGSSGPPPSAPPRTEWTSDPKARRYDDFQFLTGWEAAK